MTPEQANSNVIAAQIARINDLEAEAEAAKAEIERLVALNDKFRTNEATLISKLAHAQSWEVSMVNAVNAYLDNDGSRGKYDAMDLAVARKQLCNLIAQCSGVPKTEKSIMLRDAGYAPGNYSSTCIHCNQPMDFVDKRCRCCKPCAEYMISNTDCYGYQNSEGMNSVKGEHSP